MTNASDGSGTRCVTCDLGKPYWMGSQNGSHLAESPDGRWLLVWGFEAAETANVGRSLQAGQISDSSIHALRLNESGVATAGHRLSYSGVDEGNIRPIFTPDGRRVIWWQSRGARDRPVSEWKRWLIMVADFDVAPDGTPRLRNERALIDGGNDLIEDGGLTDDSRTYYYMRVRFSEPELFAVDLATGKERRLTHSTGWDEFPSPSPNGRAVSFISDRDRSNLICDPLFGLGQQGVETELDYLLTIPGSVVCGIGEQFHVERNEDGSWRQRAGWDAYLMDSDGEQVMRVTSHGRWGIGSWSPDSRELMYQKQVGDAARDEISFLVFAHDDRAPRSIALGRRSRTVGPGRFTLRWRAEDRSPPGVSRAGVEAFEVYARRAGASNGFRRVAVTRRGELTYRGRRGTSYLFQIRARDGLGNREAAPRRPDFVVRVR